MKQLVLFLVIGVLMALGCGQAQAQTESARQTMNEQKLHQADSLYRMHSDRRVVTQRELKAAQAELRAAQQRYDVAKRRDQEAANATKQAKKSMSMEKKAQKSRQKAETQADKARSFN